MFVAACCRFALMISSITGNSPAREARSSGRAPPVGPGSTPIDCHWNIGRTVLDFQCSAAMINGLLAEELRGRSQSHDGPKPTRKCKKPSTMLGFSFQR
jgi:hypothetical protein